MHIPDGYLSPAVCAITGLAAVGGLAWAIRRLDQQVHARSLPLTGMVAALVFAGQMVNFPLGLFPVSGHLIGGTLAAILLGPWGGCVALSLVLLIQLFLFADGGWLALGANAFNMAVVGALGGGAVYDWATHCDCRDARSLGQCDGGLDLLLPRVGTFRPTRGALSRSIVAADGPVSLAHRRG
jgi:cobalt/nickel transport system permease protein